MLGWFLGKRYRSIRATLVPFRKDQGRGDLAARLIEIAPDFKKVRSVFNDCRYDANPRGLDLLYEAMADRLRKEGVNLETRSFFNELSIEDIDEKGIGKVVSEFEGMRSDSILEDMETLKLNPGNGWLAVRLIMACSTVNEVDAIFENFNSAPHKTSKARVFAARALKKNRLLNRDDQDSDWWWDFYEEANKLDIEDGQALEILTELEKEFPVADGDQTSEGTER